MSGKTHDLAAFTALLLVITAVPALPSMTLATAIVAFSANFMGGLFPDIDQPTSDFWDNFRLGIPPWRWMRIESGAFIENWVLFPGILLAAGWLMYVYQGKLFMELRPLLFSL